jgi:predicted DsbA family dithiol-disulfide isomerase
MIDADHAKAIASGVNGTPNFFIANHLSIKGLAPYEVYRDSLDAALARAGVPNSGGRGK